MIFFHFTKVFNSIPENPPGPNMVKHRSYDIVCIVVDCRTVPTEV